MAAAVADSGNSRGPFDFVAAQAAARLTAPRPMRSDAEVRKRVASDYGRSPIRFEPNVGQEPSGVKYVARCGGFDIALTDTGVTLVLPWKNPSGARDSARQKHISEPGEHTRLRLSLVHPTGIPRLHPEQRQLGVSNYFNGKDRSRWRINVPNYGAVRYRQAYPGIDWVIHGNVERLEYDLVVAPRADPKQIKIKVEGANRLRVEGDGDLELTVGDLTLRQLKPVVYQTMATGERRSIEGGFALEHGQLSFKIGKYDRSRELVIDPTVESTYLGGSKGAAVTAIAVGASDVLYVAGNTSSTDFPTVGPIQNSNASSGGTAFVAKFNFDGSLAYSTYLGGSGTDGATAIAVDGEGNAYVAGSTTSGDFPTVRAFQGTKPGSSAAFVAKLNAAGNALVYSTYLGGSDTSNALGGAGAGTTQASGIAVDSAGSAYVAGVTSSLNFPTVEAFQSASPNGGAMTSFVAKISAEGSALVYSTYLGGSRSDTANSIAVDSAGDAYVVGNAASNDFPTVNAFQDSIKGESTAFLTKLSANGNALVYSTYLGGTGQDQANGVAVDASGEAYVTGTTNSSDFPTANAWQGTLQGGSAGFITKFNSAGNALVFSTYMTGAVPYGIALDGDADVYVAGSTTSSNLLTSEAVQDVNNGLAIGASNAFITELGPSGGQAQLGAVVGGIFSTYLGGSGSNVPSDISGNPPIPVGDSARSIAVDSTGDNIYVGGTTASSDFPGVANAFQSTKDGAVTTGFVSRINLTCCMGGGSSPPPPTSPSTSGGGGAMDWGLISGLGLALAARLRRNRTNRTARRNGAPKSSDRGAWEQFSRPRLDVASGRAVPEHPLPEIAHATEGVSLIAAHAMTRRRRIPPRTIAPGRSLWCSPRRPPVRTG